MHYRTSPTETSGMPAGIPYIIGNEAAERFSFYGMRTILVVFMAKYLLFMDKSGGFALSDAQSVAYFHQFASWVYFTPLGGALLADIFFGKYRTILTLSIVYCLGHAALACMGSFGHSEWWLGAGLVLICIGSGGIKPCVSAHVGDQFGKANHHLIPKIYNWFYFSINFGSFFSTLLTPWLLNHYGPHWAFGVPGVLMAIATFMFWLGRNRFVHIPPSGKSFFTEAFSSEGIIALCKLIPLFVFIAAFWSLYDQTGSSWVLQANQMHLKFLGITWLESQVQAVNPILILIYIPLFTFLIYPALNRVFPLTPLRKIGLGLILMVISFALVALIQSWIDAGQRPSIAWQILAYVIITASEIMVSIVGLEFAYTQAPKAMKSWVMALFWLAVWGGNQFTAQVNQYIAVPSPVDKQLEQALGSMATDWQDSPRHALLLGYDGLKGTDDDIYASSINKGRIEALEIPGREVFLAAADKIEAAAGEAFPSVAAGKKLLGNARDSWGNPLVYDLIDASHARISSAGPDRKPHTEWDIGVLLEKAGSEGDDGSPWLAQRKKELRVEEKKVVAGFTRTEFVGGQSKLEGAAYFRFFTWLMIATAVLFIPFACLYKPRTYLHD